MIDKRDIFFKGEKNSVFKSKGYRLGSDLTENETLDTSEQNFPNSNTKVPQNLKNIETQLSGNK